MYLFYDTETTGFPNRNLPIEHEKQPHICQLAALLTDSEGAIQGAMNVLIFPEGWTIPGEVTSIHGISNVSALEYGIRIKPALVLFTHLGKNAKLRIAHNRTFDDQMLNLESQRIATQDVFGPEDQAFCTMLATTEICKLPGGRGGQYKWPKLKELYKFLFNEELDNQHDAMGDVVGMKRCFFELKKRNLINV